VILQTIKETQVINKNAENKIKIIPTAIAMKNFLFLVLPSSLSFFL